MGRALGLVPGERFDRTRFTDAELTEIETGAEQALGRILGSLASFGTAANGWRASGVTLRIYAPTTEVFTRSLGPARCAQGPLRGAVHGRVDGAAASSRGAGSKVPSPVVRTG
ncbi:MAG TPA: hypothetical protein VFN97_17625 [Actinospica sp.]|nr:hypothetical protein [Actinospica sp.]